MTRVPVDFHVVEIRVEAKSYRTARVGRSDVHTNGMVSFVYKPTGVIPVSISAEVDGDGNVDIKSLATKLLILAQEGVNVTVAELMEDGIEKTVQEKPISGF